MGVTERFFGSVALFILVIVIIGSLIQFFMPDYFGTFYIGVNMALYILVALIIIFSGIKYLNS